MIYFCIVLYNKLLDDSLTWQKMSSNFVIQSSESQVLIFDNSNNLDIAQQNENSCLSKNIVYLTKSENVGLSRAYNLVLNKIQKDYSFNNNDYIVWLDDDTEVTQEWLSELSNEVSKNKYDIITPIISSPDGTIYSPNSAGIMKNNLSLNTSKQSKIKKFNAINSCLCVRLTIFDDYRYDERLFLDQVDQKFFDDLRKKEFSYKILNTQIIQNFSQRSSKIPNSYIKRFDIRCKDILVYAKLSNNYGILFLLIIKLFLLALGLFKKTKNFRYIKVMLSSVFHR